MLGDWYHLAVWCARALGSLVWWSPPVAAYWGSVLYCHSPCLGRIVVVAYLGHGGSLCCAGFPLGEGTFSSLRRASVGLYVQMPVPQIGAMLGHPFQHAPFLIIWYPPMLFQIVLVHLVYSVLHGDGLLELHEESFS